MTIGATYTRPDGDLWTVTGRAMKLNRDGGFDPNNTVASVATRYQSLELGWRGRMFGGALAAQVGAQALETDFAGRDVEPFGYVGFTYDVAR
jgi:hypothetical protein